jgi:hypothetical protein
MLPKSYDSPSIDKFVYFVYELKTSNLLIMICHHLINLILMVKKKHYTQINLIKKFIFRCSKNNAL